MVKTHNPFFDKVSIIPIMAVILIFAVYGCKSKKPETTFILDNIQYELNNGGVGYDVKTDYSLDLKKTSFVATLRITNLSNNGINLDGSKFKLTDEEGMPFSLVTMMNDMDLSPMYKRKIEPGETIDYMLNIAVPKDAHYNLHVISPISGAEKIIHY